MREILFRGKRLDNGEWVFGSLINGIYGAKPVVVTMPSVDDNFRLEFEYDHVDHATVGQYTGLTDKNGKRIFEGDIVRTQPFSDRPYSKKAKFKEHIGVVECRISPKYVSEWFVRIDDYEGFACCNWSAFYDCEIIGNIHDNPELVKGGEG